VNWVTRSKIWFAKRQLCNYRMLLSTTTGEQYSLLPLTSSDLRYGQMGSLSNFYCLFKWLSFFHLRYNIYKHWWCVMSCQWLVMCGCSVRLAKDLIHEAQMHKLRHPNIIMLLAVIFEPQHYGVLFEYVTYGALDSFYEDYEASFSLLRGSKKVKSFPSLAGP